MLDAYRTPDRLKARIALYERYPSRQEDFHRWLFSHAPAVGDARVLEVGAGTSRLWSTNADRVPPGWRLTLTDISEGMVEASKRAAAEAGLTARVLRADVQDLPFGTAAFNMAFANHMLYHVPDLARGVAELRRVLAPGSTLFAATNGEQHLAGLKELAGPLAGVVDVQPSAPLKFTLESGAEQLGEQFDRVSVLRREEELLVDDEAVVLGYLRSLVYLPETPSAAVLKSLAEWEEGVRRRLAGGPLRVRVSSGFFMAR